MATTTEQRLERADRTAEQIKRALVDAIAHLHDAPEVDDSFDRRLRAVSDRFRQLRTDLQPEDFDKRQLVELWHAGSEIPELLAAAPNLEACDAMLIRVERLRHVLRDALDEHVSGVADDTAVVMRDLRAWLPTTTRHQLAEILGVERRTLPRWEKQHGKPPSARLSMVARLVAILRHSWTEQGIVAWFYRPRRELDGRPPIEVLRDPTADEEALIAAARAGRSQYAT